MIHILASLLATCSVADYGAVGNGTTDDRPALQAAINACAVIEIPAGRYLVTRAPFVYADLIVPEGRTIRGAGRGATTLVQAPAHAGSVRLLHVAGADVTISDIALDGDRAHQTPDEHRAGVFATASPRLTIRRVEARAFEGDGFYVHMGSHDATLDDVRAISNSRNGLSFGGATRGALVTGSIFAGNGVQQIDSEPGADATVDRVTISGCHIDGSGSNDYALTVSGSGPTSRSNGWNVVGNAIRGSVLVVWADGIVVARNEIRNGSTKSCIEVYLRSLGVVVLDNTCEQTQAVVDGAAGVYVAGAPLGGMPEGVVIAGNAIAVSGRVRTYGVRADGGSSVYVAGNHLSGPGGSHGDAAGVYVRTTIIGAPLRAAVVSGNTIAGWPAGAVRIVGNVVSGAAAELQLLEVTGNVIDAAIVVDVAPLHQRRTGNRCTATTCPGDNLP